MPLVRTALIATAACLIGATAYAQTDNTSQAPQPAPQSSMPADANAQPQAPMPADANAPTGGAANTSATVDANGAQVIASQPVPDTKANRAAYGQPLSRAGKRTAPAGN
jgi:hypothetical protein